MTAHCAVTRFGFEYGAMTVERTASLPDGRTVVSIFGARGKVKPSIEVYVSPKGHRIRVFSDGEEWKP